MSAETMFRVANTIALMGWIALIFAGRVRWIAGLLTSVLIPGLLAVAYTALILTHFGRHGGSFNTLEGVATLFADRYLLLAGWIHYLAFDLFVGSWQVRDAAANRISHLIVIPFLVLTFLFGPAGMLGYLALRWGVRRKLSIS
jgi:hypothetical protein